MIMSMILLENNNKYVYHDHVHHIHQVPQVHHIHHVLPVHNKDLLIYVNVHHVQRDQVYYVHHFHCVHLSNVSSMQIVC